MGMGARDGGMGLLQEGGRRDNFRGGGECARQFFDTISAVVRKGYKLIFDTAGLFVG